MGRLLPWLLAAVGWAAAAVFAFGYYPPLSLAPPFFSGEKVPGLEAQPGSHDDGGETPPATPALPASKPVDLLDPAYPLARAGDEGWDYHQVLTADLNGDGRMETVHLIARVDRYQHGLNDFAWDDGHLWQVYVEDGEGNVTYVFSRWVQLGELRIASLDHFVDPQSRGLAILALEGARVAFYKIDYRGADDFEAVEMTSLPILMEGSLVP